MWYRHTTLTLLLAALAAPAAAQQAGVALTGNTPGECVLQANQWRTRQVTEARAAQRPVDSAALLAEARRLASACGARFRVGSVPSAQLAELASYFSYLGDTAQAHAAVRRGLAARELGQRQHADLVLLAISNILAAHDAFAGASLPAEALAAELDALPDSLDDRKIRAHQLLLGRYGYGDYADGIQREAARLLELARGRGPAGRQVMVAALADLARAAGDLLHPDSALRILEAGARELGEPIGSVSQLQDGYERYSLVGKAAAPVSGELWLNPDAPAGQVDMADGKVRLVQFTAHWCAPCRNSYPGMLRLAQRFAGKPFEVLFVTELYGNFEGRPATEAQEIAADRVYYAQHGIPFRIAVNRYAQAPSGGRSSPALNGQYAVGGIPQIVVVDQRGTIRQVVIGWDQGNEQRLGQFIDGLFTASSAAATAPPAAARPSPEAVLASPEAVLASPEPARQLVDRALAQARSEQKHVLVYFTASWCGWCHRFQAMLEDPVAGPLLQKHFVPVRLVALENGDKKALENPGAGDLLKEMGGTGGIPFYYMLDGTGKKLGDANGLPDGSNIGHPNTDEEIRAFDALLARTAPRMTGAERAQISAYLAKVAKGS